jgi:hypothetical protein
VPLFVFVQIQGLDSERVALVPVDQNSQSEYPQRTGNNEHLANNWDAGTKDQNRCKNEKQADGTFDRYVMDRNAAVVSDWIRLNEVNSILFHAFRLEIAEQEYQATGDDSAENSYQDKYPDVGQQNS